MYRFLSDFTYRSTSHIPPLVFQQNKMKQETDIPTEFALKLVHGQLRF